MDAIQYVRYLFTSPTRNQSFLFFILPITHKTTINSSFHFLFLVVQYVLTFHAAEAEEARAGFEAQIDRMFCFMPFANV